MDSAQKESLQRINPRVEKTQTVDRKHTHTHSHTLPTFLPHPHPPNHNSFLNGPCPTPFMVSGNSNSPKQTQPKEDSGRETISRHLAGDNASFSLFEDLNWPNGV